VRTLADSEQTRSVATPESRAQSGIMIGRSGPPAARGRPGKKREFHSSSESESLPGTLIMIVTEESDWNRRRAMLSTVHEQRSPLRWTPAAAVPVRVMTQAVRVRPPA
jgi:hypothetical protein